MLSGIAYYVFSGTLMWGYILKNAWFCYVMLIINQILLSLLSERDCYEQNSYQIDRDSIGRYLWEKFVGLLLIPNRLIENLFLALSLFEAQSVSPFTTIQRLFLGVFPLHVSLKGLSSTVPDCTCNYHSTSDDLSWFPYSHRKQRIRENTTGLGQQNENSNWYSKRPILSARIRKSGTRQHQVL